MFTLLIVEFMFIKHAWAFLNFSLCRFLGEKDNLRYKVPATVEREMIRRNIKSDGKILLRVPSRIEADQYYTVDMTIGVCECVVGFDGSLCTHQYIIWAENLADSLNFVLIFNIKERPRWTRIAFGTALPLTY